MPPFCLNLINTALGVERIEVAGLRFAEMNIPSISRVLQYLAHERCKLMVVYLPALRIHTGCNLASPESPTRVYRSNIIRTDSTNARWLLGTSFVMVRSPFALRGMLTLVCPGTSLPLCFWDRDRRPAPWSG